MAHTRERASKQARPALARVCVRMDRCLPNNTAGFPGVVVSARLADEAAIPLSWPNLLLQGDYRPIGIVRAVKVGHRETTRFACRSQCARVLYRRPSVESRTWLSESELFVCTHTHELLLCWCPCCECSGGGRHGGHGGGAHKSALARRRDEVEFSSCATQHARVTGHRAVHC